MENAPNEKDKLISMDSYLGLMKDTTKQVNNYLQLSLQEKLDTNEAREFNYWLNLTKPELKLLMFRLVYEFNGQRNIQEIMPLVVGLQSIVYAIYLNNIKFYNKENILEHKERLDIIDNLSEKLTRNGREMFVEIDNTEVKELMEGIITNYYSSLKKFEKLNIKNFQNYPSFDNYKGSYISALEEYGGKSWGNITKIGGLLGDLNKKYIGSFYNFGFNFGVGINVINHLGNFAPIQNEKLRVYIDQFGDIKNGFLTLPAFYVLTYGNENQKQMLKNLVGKVKIDVDEQREVAKIICNSGAYNYCLELSKKYAKDAKNYLHDLSKNEKRDYLSMIIANLDSNKYIRELKKYGG